MRADTLKGEHRTYASRIDDGMFEVHPFGCPGFKSSCGQRRCSRFQVVGIKAVARGAVAAGAMEQCFLARPKIGAVPRFKGGGLEGAAKREAELPRYVADLIH